MKKKIYLLMTVSLILASAISISIVGNKILDYRNGDRDYFDAQLAAGLANMPEKSEETKEAEEIDFWANALADTDLNSLRKVNEDVVGWITIPGTEISYPILQAEDNEYYLNHTWNRDKSSVGSIFMECQLKPDLHSFNTILYGHKMRNGSMFGSLSNYTSVDYFKEHPSIYLVMDDGVYRYDIFAAHEVKTRSIVYRININTRKRRNNFIDFCLENSVFDAGITPTVEDKILTLSTCTGNGHATRWVVQGVLHNGKPIGDTR